MVKFRNLITGFVATSVLASSFLVVAPANARIVRIPPGAIHPGPNFPGNGGQFGGMHNPGMGGAIAAAAIGGLAVGAIAASAASHQADCQIAIYNHRGQFIGYRAGDCDGDD